MSSKGIRKITRSRTALISLALIVQLSALAFAAFILNEHVSIFYTGSMVISLIAVLVIINNKSNPAYKIAWIILIMLVPIFGGLFYLFFGGNRLSRKLKDAMETIEERTTVSLHGDPDVNHEIYELSDDAWNQSRYIEQYSHYPPYRNAFSEFLPSGEVKFERLLEELQKAERYIFMEYFIISEGIMWESVLAILKEKADAGVDVRLIYDDFGCITTLPMHYHNTLESMGIKCSAFNPMLPILTLRHNNRDHRKIVVIDGEVGFTGGVNLADEYINAYERFGHWKDAAIMIKGEAVWSFTVMFLTIWGYLRGIEEDFDKFRADPVKTLPLNAGYIQPYSDSPLDEEALGETIYFNLINKAKRYVYIMTPYLIVSNEMLMSLYTAAKSGVDVRIITPFIPDKPAVHAVTRSYYRQLINSGVMIYEYTPGFVHSKTFVVDDEYGTVGTINMDFRSFYLHFECGVFLYQADCLAAMKKEFVDTLAECHVIGAEDFEGVWYKELFRSLLRVFAPLM